MNENFRLVGIILTMGVIGTLLWQWSNRETPPSQSSPAQKIAQGEPVKAVPAETKKKDVQSDSEESTKSPEVHVAPDAAEESKAKMTKAGNGSIKGKVTVWDNTELL